MKRERDPTPEEFYEFLAWLDPDLEQAACKFNLLQSRLMQIFVCRGCVDAEMLANEVSNRVTVRIEKVKKDYPDALRCCSGFVEHVHHEYLREKARTANPILPPEPRPPDELEREDRCLNECMGQLTSSDRELVERYFQGEKGAKIAGRKKLAVERKLTLNALRIQAFKLRKRLRLCLRACLEQAEAETVLV